jgi:ATP-binding cassette subfamily F protein uup
VFLVSHDRRFLDNVVTSTIAWEGEEASGLWREYEGGYADWQTQRERARALREAAARAVPAEKAKPAAVATAAPAARPRKLSYKEQRELDELPARIEGLEAEQRRISALLSDPDAYVKDAARVAAGQQRYAQIDTELLAALERWEALGSRG